MDVAAQVRYESSVRFRFAVIAFVAALTVVGSQLIDLTGVHPPVQEATLILIADSQRRSLDLLGASLDTVGLIAIAVLLYWLHCIASARRPEFKKAIRYTATFGAGLSAVTLLLYTLVIGIKAHQFVTSGNQGYPEANHLSSETLVELIPLFLELGTLMLAIGAIWVSLSTMRVGLVPRIVGYAGVIAGALFLFPIGGLVPIVQGFWLGALAVILARRWPSGDPPAWEAGVAVPWVPLQARQPPEPAPRPVRGQRRRRVSDAEVMAAVDEPKKLANPQAGKRKRKRRS